MPVNRIAVKQIESGDLSAFVNERIYTGLTGVVAFSGRFGAFALTGVPVYDSGEVATAIALPSGTVYGLKQKVNLSEFEYDASGNLIPSDDAGVTVVFLGVSMG